ncbi:Neuroepithelial Cell-Transforming 1 Protein, partial [Manis pentadactyla]
PFTHHGDSRSPASAQKSSCRSTVPTPAKRRSSVLWSETLGVNIRESLTAKEIKRQEAIYEMSRGEQDLIEDLKLARKAYHDPMLKLSIMSEEELTHIFGDLDAYIPLHEDLWARIGEATKPDGTVEQIGHILVNWLPGLNAYKGYCSNQLAVKALLDQKKQDPGVQDFLQRCLESPFSRKLDLWSFLDNPRSRLVKYTLLLKEILRHTPEDHPDILIIQVLSEINLKKGESECQYYIDKLEYLNERQKDPRIEASKVLLCHGELKNKNGHGSICRKYLFLISAEILRFPVSGHLGFDSSCYSYEVYRRPIPVQELVLEDLQDGDVRVGGSFQRAFGSSHKAKNIFRVGFQDPSPGQSHTLQANDVFHKQQWINCIRAAIAPFQQATSPAELQGLPELHEECVEKNPSAGTVETQRRASTASSVTQVEVDGDASACVSPACTSDDMKSVKAHLAQPGFPKPRGKTALGGEWKETSV